MILLANSGTTWYYFPSILIQSNSKQPAQQASSDWARVPLVKDDILKRHMTASQHGQFLFHADHHLHAGMDEQMLPWFPSTDKGEILALMVGAWNVCAVVPLFCAPTKRSRL